MILGIKEQHLAIEDAIVLAEEPGAEELIGECYAVLREGY